MKKGFRTVATMLLAALCVMMLGACGNKSQTVDLDSLKSKMLEAAGDLPEMSNADSSGDEAEDYFLNLADLDYEIVDQYFFTYSTKGTADEIAVIVLKDEEYATRTERALRDHLDSRKKLFAEYEPEEAARAKKSTVITKGNCVAFIMCQNVDEVEKAFKDFFK